MHAMSVPSMACIKRRLGSFSFPEWWFLFGDRGDAHRTTMLWSEKYLSKNGGSGAATTIASAVALEKFNVVGSCVRALDRRDRSAGKRGRGNGGGERRVCE